MTALRKPKAWNLKPQLTAAPHMWEGVDHFLIGDVKQLNDFVTSTPFTVSGSPANVLTEQGRGIEFVSADSDRISKASHQESVMTRMVLLKVTNTSSGPIVITAESPGDGLRDRSLQIVNGVFEAYVFDGSSRIVSGVTALTVGEIYHIAFTLGSGTLRLYVNGKQEGSVAASGAFEGFESPEIVYGQGLSTEELSGEQTNYANVIILQAADWLRELSADEIAEHARDPFAMLRPAGF